MLSKPVQKFTYIYTFLVSIELVCGYFTNLASLHYFTKPLIVLSLLIFFFIRSQFMNKTIRTLMIFALICSLIGDVALLFDTINPNYFIVGLASFLLAHVLYVSVFLKQRTQNKSSLTFIVVMLLYASLLFYLLKDGLGDLLISVLVYMLVILSMSTTAYLRRKENNVASFNWVFTGALLFMLSDSILALNKFYHAFSLSSILIMLTYALAQYSIVIGILKYNEKLR